MANRRSIGPRARADLDAIWSFIAPINEKAANSVIDEITTAFGMLTNNPNAGRPRSEISATMRSFQVGSYSIFYAASKSGIEIVRVMHNRRDVKSDDIAQF